MTTEWKPRFDAEIPDPPNSYRLEIDDLMTRVARARRRRTMIGGGGAMASVAAIAAIALLATTGQAPNRPDDGAPADAGPVVQPVVTLPELDPDGEYLWYPPGEGVDRTEATEAYTEALRTALTQTYPGIDFDDAEPEVVRYTNVLAKQTYVGENDGYDLDFVHEQPAYRAIVGDSDNETLTTSPVFPGSQFPESFDVQIWPAGGFTLGTDGPADLVSCESDEYQADFDGTAIENVECSEDVGPNGELIRHAYTTTSHSGTGATYWKERTTVVYRMDGTAVVIIDMIAKEDEARVDPSITDLLSDLGDREPAMTFEEQTDLILALPQAVVE